MNILFKKCKYLVTPLADGGVDLPDRLPEYEVLAVDGEVEGGVEHDEQVVHHDHILGPNLELARMFTTVLLH